MSNENEPRSRGMDRRRALQAGAGVVGAAWVTPSVLSLTAQTAAASSGTSVASVGTVTFNTGADTQSVALPATGSFLLLLAACVDNRTLTGPGSPWTQIAANVGATAAPKLSAWWALRSAVGTTAPTITPSGPGGKVGVIIGFNAASTASAGTSASRTAAPLSPAGAPAYSPPAGLVGTFVFFGAALTTNQTTNTVWGSVVNAIPFTTRVDTVGDVPDLFAATSNSNVASIGASTATVTPALANTAMHIVVR